MIDVDALARTLGLGALLAALEGGYELVDHWQQGEFHHDVVVRTDNGAILVVATNCNGGVKEVLAFAAVPDRWALWRSRCPDNAELAALSSSSSLPALLGRATTEHWFDPCALLVDDARSELKVACRKRAVGGGWEES